MSEDRRRIKAAYKKKASSKIKTASSQIKKTAKKKTVKKNTATAKKRTTTPAKTNKTVSSQHKRNTGTATKTLTKTAKSVGKQFGLQKGVFKVSNVKDSSKVVDSQHFGTTNTAKTGFTKKDQEKAAQKKWDEARKTQKAKNKADWALAYTKSYIDQNGKAPTKSEVNSYLKSEEGMKNRKSTYNAWKYGYTDESGKKHKGAKEKIWEQAKAEHPLEVQNARMDAGQMNTYLNLLRSGASGDTITRILKNTTGADKYYDENGKQVTGVKMDDAGRLVYKDKNGKTKVARTKDGKKAKSSYGKEILDAATKQTVYGYTEGNRFATGVLEGSNPLPVSLSRLGPSNFSQADLNVIEKGKNSKSYAVGNMVGLMATMVGTKSGGVEDAIAQRLVRNMSKKALAKQGIKATDKEIMSAIERLGKGKRSAITDAVGNVSKTKKYAAQAVGGVGSTAYIDTADALRMATDEEGNVDLKALAGYGAMNIGLGGAMSAGMKGVGDVVTSATGRGLKKISKASDVYADIGENLPAELASKASRKTAKLESADIYSPAYNTAQKQLKKTSKNVNLDGYKAGRDIKDNDIANTVRELRTKESDGTITKAEQRLLNKLNKNSNTTAIGTNDARELARLTATKNVRELSEREANRLTILQRKADTSIRNKTKYSNVVKSIESMPANTDVKFNIVSNAEMEELAKKNGVKAGETANGIYRKGSDGRTEIIVNADSPKAHQTIIGHESGHLVKDSSKEDFSRLGDMLKDYARKNGEYDDIVSEVKKSYIGEEAEAIDDEVICEMIGRYIFGEDDKFIKQLNNKKVLNTVKKFIGELSGKTSDKAIKEEYAKILGRISASEDDIITRFSKSSEASAKIDELAKRFNNGEDIDDIVNGAYELVKANTDKIIREEVEVGIEEIKEAKRFLRTTKINITTTDATKNRTINKLLENVGYDKETVKSRINLRKNSGISIETAYNRLREIDSDIFPELDTEEDMLKRMCEITQETSQKKTYTYEIPDDEYERLVWDKTSELIKLIDAKATSLKYKDAKVSTAKVSDLSLEQLRKERKSLEFGIKNGKTESHIELRKERLKDVEAEIRKRTPNYTNEGALDELDGAVAKPTETKKKSPSTIKEKLTQIRREYEDSLIAFETLAKKNKDDAFLNQVNQARNADKIAKSMISNRQVSSSRKVVGKSLDDVFAVVKDSEEKRQDFGKYLLLKHSFARAKQNKDIFGGNWSLDKTVTAINELESKYGKSELSAFEKDVRTYIDNLNQYRVDTGILSKTQLDELNAKYPNYVPTNRVSDETKFFDAGLGKKVGGAEKEKTLENSIDNGIKTAIGGSEPIKDLYEQLSDLTIMTVRNGEQNKMVRMYAENIGVTPDVVRNASETEILGAVMNPKYKNGEYTLSFYSADGTPVTINASKDAVLGLREWNGHDKNAFFKAITNDKLVGGTRVFKGLITDWNLLFGIRNGARDMQQSFINTKDLKYYTKSIADATQALKNKNDPFRIIYDNNGGAYSTLVETNQIAKEAKKNIIYGIELINEKIESMPRMTEFIGTIKKEAEKNGVKTKDIWDKIDTKYKSQLEEAKKLSDPDERLKAIEKIEDEMHIEYANSIIDAVGSETIDRAIRNANDITLNFSRSGYKSKALNSGLVPYFNPSIQGLSKLVRMFSEGKASKTLLNFAAKLGAITIAPAVLNELLLKNDENYQALPTREKDNNFFIPMGDGKYIKIPKPRENAVLAEPFEYGLRWFLNKSEYGTMDEMKQMFKTGLDNIGVVNPFTDNLFSPILSTLRNKTWYGGDIESAYEIENFDTKDRYDEGTTAVAIWLGQTPVAKAMKLSPKKIDNIMDSYLGMIYDFGISQTSQKNRGSIGLKSNPFVNQFIKDSVFSNKESTKFWDNFSQMEKGINSKSLTDNQKEKKKQEFENLKSVYYYDICTLSEAISDATLDKSVPQSKVREMRKELNRLYKLANDGESNTVEPISVISKAIGSDKALSKYLPESDESDYSWKEYYKNFKKSVSYSKLSKADKKKESDKFLEVYSLGVDTQKKINPADYHSSPDWNTVGVSAAQLLKEGKITNKDYKKVSLACNIYEDSLGTFKKYVRHGGNTYRYAVTQKRVDKMFGNLDGYGIDTKSGLWKGSFGKGGAKGGAISVQLASGKTTFLDRAYYISNSRDENYAIKMNAARGYTSRYNKTTEDICKLALKADKKGDNNTYLNQSEIRDVCDSIKGNSELKAMSFVLLGGNPNKNPYGSIGDYSRENDTGIKADGESSSSGGRGWGRRGRRRGGGGSGGSSKGTVIETTSGAVDGKVTNPFSTGSNGSSASNLNDAYRKRLKKLREQTRK